MADILVVDDDVRIRRIVQINLERAKPDAGEGSQRLSSFGFVTTKSAARFAGFVFRGFLWGLLGFWIVPMMLGAVVPYDHGEYGDRLFFFILIIFINIHHYFIDNAMWRKENPHTLPHLFARR